MSGLWINFTVLSLLQCHSCHWPLPSSLCRLPSLSDGRHPWSDRGGWLHRWNTFCQARQGVCVCVGHCIRICMYIHVHVYLHISIKSTRILSLSLSLSPPPLSDIVLVIYFSFCHPSPWPQLPEVHPNAKLLQPPPPILQTEANWPLLTVSRGFFDGIANKGPGVMTSMDAEDQEPEGWGDDAELLLDDGNQIVVINS